MLVKNCVLNTPTPCQILPSADPLWVHRPYSPHILWLRVTQYSAQTMGIVKRLIMLCHIVGTCSTCHIRGIQIRDRVAFGNVATANGSRQLDGVGSTYDRKGRFKSLKVSRFGCLKHCSLSLKASKFLLYKLDACQLGFAFVRQGV